MLTPRTQWISLALSAAMALTIPIEPVIAQATLQAGPDELTIESKALGEARKVLVITPPGYQGGTRSYPVLILLDAGDREQFAAAVSSARFLADRDAIPQLLIVGIPSTKDRSRDLTPPNPSAASLQRLPTAGGGDAFLDYVTKEVLPLVRGRFRTTPYTIFAGHSLGGLIGVYLAASRPGAFDAIIAMSPALQWNGSAVVEEYAKAINGSNASLRLFTTSGGGEPEIDRVVLRFAKEMEQRSNHKVVYGARRYPDDSHMMTPLVSLIDGLRFVFAP